jgi:uncharacterized protein YdiU (UPF0061 family)
VNIFGPFRKRPLPQEAVPWWADVIFKRLGLILKKVNNMATLDEVLNALSDESEKIDRLISLHQQQADRQEEQAKIDQIAAMTEANRQKLDSALSASDQSSQADEPAPPVVPPQNSFPDQSVGTTTSAAGSPGA